MELDEVKKNSIVTRLTTGIVYNKYANHLYKLVPPTSDVRAFADFFYRQAVEDQKYKEIMTRKQAERYLAKKQIWTPKDDEGLDKMQKAIESLKIDLYKALYKPKEQEKIRKSLTKLNKGLEGSFTKKYMFDHITIEANAEKIRDEIMIALSIQTLDGQCVYNYDNLFRKDNKLLTSFLLYLSRNMIKTEHFRYIARNEPFRLIWTIGKEGMFGVPAINLTYEQRTIILYSRMYDNVYESPEKPTEAVINDDDMLDGWFADRRIKYEEERKKQEAENILNNKGANKNNGGEIFVVVDSNEEARKIQELNDLNAKKVIQQRQSVLKPGESIPDEKLPDVQQELRQQAVELMKNRRKQ